MNRPLTGLRIGLVTASASRLGGGVFEVVASQAALIRDLGGEVRVFALEDRHSTEDAHRFAGSELVLCPVIGPAQIGYAPQLLPRLLEAELDCLHLHGIWMYPSRAATGWVKATQGRYIISTHAMLNAWTTGRNRWKKVLARVGYERESWRSASLLHALTNSEVEDIHSHTGRSDVVVIPNPAPNHLAVPLANRAPVVAYIGRMHSRKNLLALIAGWKQARLPTGAQLLIAGWGEPAEVARIQAAATAADSSVRFLGPTFGKEKQDLLDQARFTILPSLGGEGMPMAILESWAAGTPTILTPACNLPEGFAAGAALECGPTSESIAQAIEAALRLDDEAWRVMAQAAQTLARGPFSPASVGARWVAAYRGDGISAPVPA